jgi:hypothetical protein
MMSSSSLLQQHEQRVQSMLVHSQPAALQDCSIWFSLALKTDQQKDSHTFSGLCMALVF